MPKKKPQPFRLPRFVTVLLVVVVVAFIGFLIAGKAGLFSQLFEPLTIAELRSDYARREPICDSVMRCDDSGQCYETTKCVENSKPIRDENGCYYQQVKCVKAPCEPIMVCPSGAPSASPASSCVPLPTCPEGRRCDLMVPKLAPGQVYCNGDSPKPTKDPGRICTQVAGTCQGIDGTCVNYTDGCQQQELCAQPIESCRKTLPTSQPIPSGKLEYINFNMSCGTASFRNITYQCESGERLTYTDSTCVPAAEAYRQIAKGCLVGQKDSIRKTQ